MSDKTHTHEIIPLTTVCGKRMFNIDLPETDCLDMGIKLNDVELEGFNGTTALTIAIPNTSAAALIRPNFSDELSYIQLIFRGQWEASTLLGDLEHICKVLRNKGAITPYEHHLKERARSRPVEPFKPSFDDELTYLKDALYAFYESLYDDESNEIELNDGDGGKVTFQGECHEDLELWIKEHRQRRIAEFTEKWSDHE